jgi:Co/Zn/Cd efflux system component
MNMRALVLHVIGDALGNVGVIATGLVILLAEGDWRLYFDPCISLVISVIIFSSAWPLGTQTLAGLVIRFLTNPGCSQIHVHNLATGCAVARIAERCTGRNARS